METAAVNKKVFMELLFWKTARDAAEIENNYEQVPEYVKEKNQYITHIQICLYYVTILI